MGKISRSPDGILRPNFSVPDWGEDWRAQDDRQRHQFDLLRGKFARLCVEVDITKPLLAKFWLKRKVRRIEYEGVHLICFICRTYGHNAELCTQSQQESDKLTEQAQGTDKPNGEWRQPRTRKDNHQDNSPETKPEVKEAYGPWMIAARNPRRQYQNVGRKDGGKNEREREMQRVSMEGGNVETHVAGSRYGILREESVTEVEENGGEGRIATETTRERYVGSESKDRSRGRRPAVQVSEKQVMGEKGSGQAMSKETESLIVRSKDHGQPNRIKHANQAAAAEDHTVVRGENNGMNITKTVIRNNNNSLSIGHGIPEFAMDEHVNDPPIHQEEGDDNMGFLEEAGTCLEQCQEDSGMEF